MGDDEKFETVEVPPAVVEALRNVVPLLRASWAEDDEVFAALVDGFDIWEARSVIGTFPFLLAFALTCPPGQPREWFANALAADVAALEARQDGDA